jgi:hypothetical protein
VCGEFYEGGPRVRRPPVKWSAVAETSRNTGLEWEVLTFNNVTMLIVPIQASCRNAFRGYSSLHLEFCDPIGTIDVATPGVDLSALCRMLSWGPYLLLWETFLGVSMIGVSTPGVSLSASYMLSWGIYLQYLQTFGVEMIGFATLSVGLPASCRRMLFQYLLAGCITHSSTSRTYAHDWNNMTKSSTVNWKLQDFFPFTIICFISHEA